LARASQVQTDEARERPLKVSLRRLQLDFRASVEVPLTSDAAGAADRLDGAFRDVKPMIAKPRVAEHHAVGRVRRFHHAAYDMVTGRRSHEVVDERLDRIVRFYSRVSRML